MRARILAVLLALWLAAGAAAGSQPSCTNPPKPSNLFLATVSRVVDGDTIHVQFKSGPSERVRLIGIDTPEVHESAKLERDSRQSGKSKEEIQALGRLASEFTKRHLGGEEIDLEYDVQIRDQYGRSLAYVWLPSGVLFNALILREGYAQVLTIPPNVKYANVFLACQREGRENRRGLWAR